MVLIHMRAIAWFERAPGNVRKEWDLNAEIVFEVKYRGSVSETRSEFTPGRNNRPARPVTHDILSLRRWVEPLLLV